MSVVTLPRPTASPAASATLADLEVARSLVASDHAARSLLAATSPDPDLDGALATWLYPRWWAASDGADALAPDADALSPVLEAARRATSPVDEGLLVLASDGVRLVAGRRGSRSVVHVAADAVVGSSRPGCPARPGDLVDVIAGSGGPDAEGVWWWARTDDATSGTDLDRWYAHVRPADAPAAVEATIRLSHRLGVGLSLKCPTTRAGFGRRDALVVYVPRAARALLLAEVEAWWGELAGLLEPEVPPLTRRLAPGLATAEDPGDGSSYGQLRCAQIAAALVRVGPSSSRATRLAALVAVGIDPDRPEEVLP